MKHFGNKIAIVTGGASGIGKAICVYLARHGANVVIADLDFDRAQETESSIASQGGHGKAVCVDVSNPQDVASLIENALNDYGQIDFLFNNAGISINGEFQDCTLPQWERILDVNLWGTVYGCHYVYPIMMKQGSGHIINTASLGGLIPGGLTTIYSASKHAVVGFSLTLRAEAKQYGIRVSALCPGYMRTNIQSTTPNVSEFMNSERSRRTGADMKFPTPEDCIDQMMSGVRKNKGIIVSPTKHKLYWWIFRIYPEFMPRFFDRVIRTMKKES